MTRRRRDDGGAASVEYVGIGFVVLAIVTSAIAQTASLSGTPLALAIQDAVCRALGA